MDDRMTGRSALARFSRCHGGPAYRLGRALPLAVLLSLAAGNGAAAAEAVTRLGAAGKPRMVTVPGPGQRAVLRFVAVSGCRYRLTVAPEGSGQDAWRPLVEIGRKDEDAFARADAGLNGASAVHVFNAVQDEWLEARVRAFSLQSGRARVTLETLGVGDEPTRAHHRVLPLEAEKARVGELHIGATNTWDLEVTPGEAYQVTPTEGSAGRVHLQVLLPDDTVLGDSERGALRVHPFPPVRFQAPDPLPPLPAGAKYGPVRLVVRGTFDGGGTYGLRLRPLAEGETLDPPEAGLAPAPEPEVLSVSPFPTFRVGPGDLAVLYVPNAGGNVHVVQSQRGDRWFTHDDLGQEGRARTHYDAGMNWFRPHVGGTYRFFGTRGPTPADAELFLLDRVAVGGAPIHLGTGVDPSVKIRLDKTWRLTGLAACMPGWDYLFIAFGAPGRGLSMRVIGPDGRKIAGRGSAARAHVEGHGPSLRFRPRKPGLYRLEARIASGSRVRAVVMAAMLRQTTD